MNAVSARTKNQNLLKAKTKSFKEYHVLYLVISKNLKIYSGLSLPPIISPVKYRTINQALFQ